MNDLPIIEFEEKEDPTPVNQFHLKMLELANSEGKETSFCPSIKLKEKEKPHFDFA